MQDLPVLIAVRVQGLSPPDRLASAIGEPEDHAARRAQDLVDAGLAMKRTGRMEGYCLTPEGNAALDKALADEGLRGDEVLTDAYERFLPLNDELLQVASDWQVRKHGGVETPNDHTDAAYDQGVLDRLFELHDKVLVVVRKMMRRAPRYSPYRGRLNECVERLESGDTSALTAALKESYHTVWYELHEDLLLTLDLERES